MTSVWIQRAFRPFRDYLPGVIAEPIRSVATAFVTPILFSWRTGHFRSSFRRAAVSRAGEPLPWYTYPCIDFLSFRDYAGKSVLEFGAGQSTLWWARRARRVVSFEGGPAWYEHLRSHVAGNVDLHLAPTETPQACLHAIEEILTRDHGTDRFDVIVIDGLCRADLVELAVRRIRESGIIICDNSEGHSFFERFRDRDFGRVDFFGYTPGTVLPHCTSVFFRPGSFVFDAHYPIPVIAAAR